MMKIMVVDDDDTNLDFLENSLRTEGFEVLRSNNPADAIKVIDQDPEIEWVITDMVMPGIDGDQFITMLSDEKYKSVNIIAMTGQSLGLLTKTFAKHKGKKKVFPVLKPVKIDLLIMVLKKGA